MFSALFNALAVRAASGLPSQCRICRAWPSRPACDACVARFAQPRARCRTCALPLGQMEAGNPGERPEHCARCRREPPPLSACHAAVDYVWPWSECIARFKFGGEPGWARTFALLLRSTPWVEPALEGCDLVVPLALAPARLRERGFNQAMELARHLAPGRTDATLLHRVRETAPQASLGRAERLANRRHAFAVDPLRRERVAGRDVVLVDDVMTSGASLFAAADALRQAGAARVTALVVARTED